MNMKRSIGVTLVGLFLAAYGLVIFLFNLLSVILILNKDAHAAKAAVFLVRLYPSLRNAGIPVADIGGFLVSFIRMIYRTHPFLVLVSCMIIPFLGFMLFLGGMGILRLKEYWRRGSMIFFGLLVAVNYCTRIYEKFYFFYIMVVAKAQNSGGKGFFSGIQGLAGFFSFSLVSDFIFSACLICLLVFFLTRLKVKAQFAQ